MQISSAIRASVLAASCLLACEEPSNDRHAAPGGGPGIVDVSQGRDAGSASQGSSMSDGRSGSGHIGEGGSGSDATSDPEGGAEGSGIGIELRVEVGAARPTFVDLASASVVDLESAGAADWDLQLQGWDIFTNGGASGGGKGAAFGPLPFTYFAAEQEPAEVPFLIEDKASGAFLDWYLYDSRWHSLYSRYHVYGVRSGRRLFKLQVLGYYGEIQGAPIAALYRLRYAEVTADGSSETREVAQLDATAGGLGADEGATSACLSLSTGELAQLTPARAAESSRWDLAFRRDSISINGGRGGPGDVTAVDLDAARTESETLDGIQALTAENQAERFAAVDYEALTAAPLDYRGDRIVSVFTDAWVRTGDGAAVLATDNVWLVAGRDGQARFMLLISGIERSTADAAGTVVMRILRVR